MTSPSSGTKQVPKNTIISYILSEQIRFFSYSKITSANLCKTIHDIKNYSTFICPFESRQFGKRKIFKKLNILGTKRAFQMNKNTFFVVFEGLSSGEKIKM